MAERFAQMREAMNELQTGSEQALAKILDRGQYSRIKQIQLQMEGIPALLRPDMAEKLSISEEQAEEIQGLLREGRQSARENGRAYFEIMREAVPDQGNNAQNANNPQNGQNGQNAGNNGRGGRNGPNMRDPAVQAAVKSFMDKPATKAKLEEMKSQNDKLQNQLVASVNRILSRRQATAYKKMLGPAFDMAKLAGGPGQAPGNRNGRGNQANASSTAAKAQASDDDEAPAAKPAAKAAAKAKSSTTTTKRKSLRELRGLDQ